MNIKTTLILATTAMALLASPASARIDGDEGGASAFPRFHSERWSATDPTSAYAFGYNGVEPRANVRRPYRAPQVQPRR
jgi:hypothetical protein